jgi:hypothetical protein
MANIKLPDDLYDAESALAAAKETKLGKIPDILNEPGIRGDHCDDRLKVSLKLSMYNADFTKALMPYKVKFDSKTEISCKEKKIEHALHNTFMQKLTNAGTTIQKKN